MLVEFYRHKSAREVAHGDVLLDSGLTVDQIISEAPADGTEPSIKWRGHAPGYQRRRSQTGHPDDQVAVALDTYAEAVVAKALDDWAPEGIYWRTVAQPGAEPHFTARLGPDAATVAGQDQAATEDGQRPVVHE